MIFEQEQTKFFFQKVIFVISVTSCAKSVLFASLNSFQFNFKRWSMANTITSVSQPDAAPHPNMLWIPSGTFRMGSEDFYPEERPAHEVSVDGFWIDRYAVPNEQFARFVAATGYVTLAERPLNAADFPGAPVENLQPG